MSSRGHADDVCHSGYPSGTGTVGRGKSISSNVLPTSTLHLTDDATTPTADACVHATPEPVGTDLLVVAFAGSPVRWFEGWRTAVGDPERATFVVTDAAAWLAGHPRDRIEAVAPADTTVRTEAVDSPGNLTDLGVTLTERLMAADEHDSRTVLCCQSVTVLLQYSTLAETYQFLHTLLGHVEQFDAVGHFHLHEDAHDDETVATLRSLFDRVRRDGDD